LVLIFKMPLLVIELFVWLLLFFVIVFITYRTVKVNSRFRRRLKRITMGMKKTATGHTTLLKKKHHPYDP
jgi:thiosulfate reductase cytochrome b subunit